MFSCSKYGRGDVSEGDCVKDKKRNLNTCPAHDNNSSVSASV